MSRFRTLRLLLAVASLMPLGCAAQPPAASAPPAGAAAVAFVDVSVVPMDRERVLEHHTVVVQNGRIAQLGATRDVRVPSGAVRVDGRGKFLMPGLAEMHAHIPGGNAPPQLIRDIMFLYVANGITTIRGMLGAPNQLELRRQTAAGEVLGPTIFVGAPSLNANSAPDPASAVRLVREHKAAGYDFLKLHPGLSLATYDAMAVEARAQGITFAGHVSSAVGLAHTLATRQSTIDHLDGYIDGVVPAELRERARAGHTTFGEFVRAASDEGIRRAAQETRAAGVWNVPTVILWEHYWGSEPVDDMLRRPELVYVPRDMVAGWVNQKRNVMRSDSVQGISIEDRGLMLATHRRVLKALADAGAGLLMGTDSPQLFNVPGFALHREIRAMSESGLTPWQILQSGTSNVARYAAESLRQDSAFGTVAVGNRADLVLLDGNPLADVANVARRSGVMVRGRWLAREELDRGLAELAARNAH